MKRPGGELAKRPLHFIWVCDCSGSMSIDGKIEALNRAIRDAVPAMQRVAHDNPHTQVLLRVIRFSHGAAWHTRDAVALEDFHWIDLAADPLESGPAAADVVFLVDTSGSMADEIEAVKRSCGEFARHIEERGSNVRLGLVGFSIGGHRRRVASGYTVVDLKKYTIGIWPLSNPSKFRRNVQTLSLGLFGGAGCYIADEDTVEIFPHLISVFDKSTERTRIVVLISDEVGGTKGLRSISALLNRHDIRAHVLGVKGKRGAHVLIAQQTGGTFWDIHDSRGAQDFVGILSEVAEVIAKETVKRVDGRLSAGTDMGAAMRVLESALSTPPMNERALPPVVVLISDGRPTDDFERALDELFAQPWVRKAVRIAVAIGQDSDIGLLQRFLADPERVPLEARNAVTLVKQIRWASTAVLKAASSPPSQVIGREAARVNVPVPDFTPAGDGEEDVW